MCMWCEVGYGVRKRRGPEDHTPVHYRSPEKNTYRETPQDHQTVCVCVRERGSVCVDAESKPYFISSGEKDSLVPRLIRKKEPEYKAGWR